MTMSKHFFPKLTKFLNVYHLIAQKQNLFFFFKNLSYQKEQDFLHYKMCSAKWDLPTYGDKNALKQPHTFVELRL